MSIIGSIYVRLREKTNPLLGPRRRKQLKYPTFTIISNNCWAGHCYRYFQVPYNTPTIGLYFFPDEYVKFVSRLEYYLSLDLTFIDCKDSKHRDILEERGEDSVPIGRLEDVEIVFLHYKTREEAYEKWNRRKARMDWNHLIVKFSEMNGCTDRDLQAFDSLPYDHKFVLTRHARNDIKSAIHFPGHENEQEIANDTTYFNRGLDLVEILNRN